jgi:hypothetical protein
MVISSLMPRDGRKPESIGCSLVVVGLTGTVAVVIAVMLVTYLSSIIPLSVMAQCTPFWSPKQQKVVALAQDEEEFEQRERQEMRKRIEDATKKRLDEMKPVDDPASLGLVSEECLRRMEREIGQPIRGLRVVSEKGRMFSDERDLTTVIPILPYIFSRTFGVEKNYAHENAALLEHVFHPRAEIPFASIPLITTQRNNVMTIRLDRDAADTSYISLDEATRLHRDHGLSEPTIAYLRNLTNKMVEADPNCVNHGYFDAAILPASENEAVRAISIRKINDKLRIAPVRVAMPSDASEYFAEQIFVHIVKHIIAVLFGTEDAGTSLGEQAGFKWSYVYAVHHNMLGNGSHDILLLVGKKTNSERDIEVLEYEHKMSTKTQEMTEKILSVKAEMDKESAESDDEDAAV